MRLESMLKAPLTICGYSLVPGVNEVKDEDFIL